MNTTVIPKTETIGLLLTARAQGISHHDPAMGDGSNVMMFRRMPRLVQVPQAKISVELMLPFYAANPAPTELAAILRDLSFVEFAATAFVRLFLDRHNHSEGMGYFENADKFSALQRRLAQIGVKSNTFLGAWDNLCRSMGVEYESSGGLLQFFALPPEITIGAMAVLAKESHSIVEIARFWHNRAKQASPKYAAAIEESTAEMITISPRNASVAESDVMVLQIPALSGNSIRHQFREAAWRHMAGVLGISEYTVPGHGELPPMVEALFVNGGNIVGGAKAPSNAAMLAGEIRLRYPVVDAFSGTTNAFWLGKSAVDVFNWLVCRENREAISNPVVSGSPQCSISAFELLQDITETRKATQRGVGQMIQNFEILAAGTQFYIELKLQPSTNSLTKGAILHAIKWFAENTPKIGGQAARGYALVDVDVIATLADSEDLADNYTRYLRDNADELRAGLADGTLGTGNVIL